MGVWIEMIWMSIIELNESVAPFVGVWIEITSDNTNEDQATNVAPFVGVWIEIALHHSALHSRSGRSLRGSVD